MTLFRNVPIDVKISACVGEEKNRVNSVSPRNVAIVKQNLQENQRDILEMYPSGVMHLYLNIAEVAKIHFE